MTASFDNFPTPFFDRFPRWGLTALVVGLLFLGGLLRLIDATDPPLDFHPTRQLHSAIVARSLYYKARTDIDPMKRDAIVRQRNAVGRYEPPILETVVAWGYRLLGHESWVVPRLINTLLWLIAGLALFDVARRETNTDGALTALAFYLLLPFSVQASRSFQPDPGMTMWVVLSAWALYRWAEQPTWKWAIGAGLFGGLAALTKIVAAYLVGGAALGIVLTALGLRKALRHPQVWSMVALMALPSAWYYLLGNPGGASGYFVNWTLKLLHLIADPAFYVRWMSFLHTLFGLTPLFLGLLGVLLASGRLRLLLLGLWGGYFVYGLTLPYQMYTHSYYHLQLVPIVALSLAPVAKWLFGALARQPRVWQWAGVGLLLLAIVYPSWVARSTLLAKNFRDEPGYWQEVASAIPVDGSVVALTQDYGYRLMYFGQRRVKLWPSVEEQGLAALRGKESNFADAFARFTEGRDYFVVTAMGQWNRQPELRTYLTENYPLIAEGDGYLIFDLTP